MNIALLHTEDERRRYDAWVASHPQGNLWQSSAWRMFQGTLGREVRVYAVTNNDRIVAGALVTIDRTVRKLSTWELMRGPIADNDGSTDVIDALMDRIVADAKQDRCFCVYASPTANLLAHRDDFETSSRHVMPEATRILDLTLADDALLAQMHQKGRYNIGVAERKEVTVSPSTDIDAYYRLASKTSQRDQFTIPSKRHLEAFLMMPGSFLFLAHAPDSSDPIAGLIGLTWETTGIYYYGASDYAHRSLMAPYALQWHAIQHCKKNGCMQYDLLGVAPEGADDDHPWKGISFFKEKFGGEIVSYPKEKQYVLRPIAKMLLEMKRRIIG